MGERTASRACALAGLGLALFPASCSGKQAVATPPPPVVSVAAVAQRDVPVYSEYIGTLDANVNADARARVVDVAREVRCHQRRDRQDRRAGRRRARRIGEQRAVFVAVLCRPEEITAPAIFHPALVDHRLFQWTRIPQLSWLAFGVAMAVLLYRFLVYRKPVESGLLWSLTAAFLSLQAGGLGRVASAYLATGGLILASSIVENSYALAYRDELTELPSRRAFNDALLGLEDTYTIAMVDVDHFKKFNDTYGHEIGDQVLRMVAAKLARVSGGGQAFRVGGEEFCILFPGKSIKDVLPHLEMLRSEIETGVFRARAAKDRRHAPLPGHDRRKSSRRKIARPQRAPVHSAPGELSVTASMGVAEPSGAQEVEQVIQAADKALYRAKQGGRNRVEAAGPARARLKRSIA